MASANFILRELNEQTRLAANKEQANRGSKGEALVKDRFRRMVLFKRQFVKALDSAGPLDIFEY